MNTFLAHLTFLILISNHSGLPQLVILSCLLIYSVCVFRFLVREGIHWDILSRSKLLLIFLVLTIISHIRTNNGNISTQTILINVYSFGICFLYYSYFIITSVRGGRNPFLPIINVVSFSSLINTLIFVVYGNIRSSAPDVDSVLISLLTGNSSAKMNCTFGALSVNHNAVLIAIVLPFIFFIKQKIWRISFLLINIISLILIDSRTAFLAVLIAALLFYPLIKMRIRYASSIFVLGLPLSALFYTVISPFASQVPDLEFLARNTQELYTANSRTIIWSEVIEDISTVSGPTLIGSGDYGNLAFRSSEKYLPIFRNFDDSAVKTSHNTYFQIILDNGYLFFVMLAIVFWRVVNSLVDNKQNTISIILTISLLTFLLAGISEVLIGFYYMPTTFVFLIIIFYVKNYPHGRLKNAL